jgi:UDP-galactopyranose mutase
LEAADLVFTGGRSLHEAKRGCHRSVHLFPSSIDVVHFKKARCQLTEPADQMGISRPRLGFSGVIDERMDIALLDAVTQMRPEWQFMMVGPIVKISAADLPKRDNLHLLGAKPYRDLPEYLAGWDVALLPFARNEATRFISPTKTPEYLAAGLPTVSTSIQDVIYPYGELGLVSIADDPEAFVAACEQLMRQTAQERETWQQRVDEFISTSSWDQTWKQMQQLIDTAVSTRESAVLSPL